MRAKIVTRTFSVRVPACAYKTAHLLDLSKKNPVFSAFRLTVPYFSHETSYMGSTEHRSRVCSKW